MHIDVSNQAPLLLVEVLRIDEGGKEGVLTAAGVASAKKYPSPTNVPVPVRDPLPCMR